MSNTLQIRRGANASLPTLAAGEFGFSTDTHQIYIGDGAANHELARVSHTSSKTTAAWSKSIGSGGDYATWAAMIADMPDLIAHQVTVTIKAGTTLTETCDLKNKSGLTSEAAITIQTEKYFPTSGSIPTADSATTTTLRDAALATAALGNDYFNGCWVFVVDGTGTDNGFVPITDYVDATGDVVVASWPGTQPDNTSRYLIVGALVDAEVVRLSCFDIADNTIIITTNGVGIKRATGFGYLCQKCTNVIFNYCGTYDIASSGVVASALIRFDWKYSGTVNCNTSNNASYGGIALLATLYSYIYNSGLSDNNRQGIIIRSGGYAVIVNNFGNANGLWGTYAQDSGQAKIIGVECSGSSGNHSDPGTAGAANADQAAAY